MVEPLPLSEDERMPDEDPQTVLMSAENLSAYENAMAFQKLLETRPTDDVCKCQWIEFRGKKALGNTHILCPVHSREGRLMAFLTFLNARPGWVVRYNPPTPDSTGTTLDVQSTKQGSTTTAISPTGRLSREEPSLDNFDFKLPFPIEGGGFVD